MRRLLCMVSIILSLALPLAHGEIYKWVDGHGRVHFSDTLAGVPPAYRDQVEARSSTPAAPVTPAAPLLPPAPLPVPDDHTVPVRRVGNIMLVDAVFNGSLKTTVLVDTGAALTLIPTTTAQRLGLDLGAAAVVPLQAANGVFLAPLTTVRSLAVGGATVHEVEVVVHDIAPGRELGLLGMSFLDAFDVTISATEGRLTLTPFAAAGAVYGGHAEEWWRRKFRFYRRQIATLEAYLAKQPAPQLQRSLHHFRTALAVLERQATHAAVPRHWRQ